MTALTSTASFEVEASTPNHWVASWNDIVMVVAYEGSSADVAHLHVCGRVVERVARRYPGKARLLFALPRLHGRPPEAHVRTAVIQTAKRLERDVDRAALVIAGEGFMAAVHRGAATGIFAFVRPRTAVKITTNVRDALHFLAGTNDGMAALVEACEARLVRPA